MNFPDKFYDDLLKSHREATECPPPKRVVAFFDDLLSILFPEFADTRFTTDNQLRKNLEECRQEFQELLMLNMACNRSSEPNIAEHFFGKLPEIRSLLLMDIDAIYRGDPAAKSRAEVTRSYPGFFAIAAHRLAHVLEKQGILIIPRVISEYAHRQTGIDIHPGAKIGQHFCIDHGTGIVIGETTEIGNHVKIYQGVTLGGLSVKKEDARTKRHPTIEDRVVLYAGATILGGDTVIGKGSTIGGNVWLTKSAPPGSKIYYQAKMTNADGEGETDTITFK